MLPIRALVLPLSLSLSLSLSGLLPVLAVAVPTSPKCSLAFDGRVPKHTTLDDFDATATSPFRPDFVYGANLTWSEILKLPSVLPSVFDLGVDAKPLEVTIDDRSVFAPSATDVQTGFRRAELLPAIHSGENVYVTGQKTLHFSLMADHARPLNYSHEYQLVWVERADYATDQIELKTGQLIGGDPTANPRKLVLQGNQAAAQPITLFEVDFVEGIWYNFGLELDFTKNTTRVLFSTDYLPLLPHGPAVSNDISGLGEWHFGILKKPTGTGLTDITRQGYQESGIHEGIVYGGIFQEDSSTGCVSLF